MTDSNDRTPALPCFVCGTQLFNVFRANEAGDNQPDEGTEFRTRGHYGSTFWDSFDGEDLILNVCDPCLRLSTERLGIQRTEVTPVKPYADPETAAVEQLLTMVAGNEVTPAEAAAVVTAVIKMYGSETTDRHGVHAALFDPRGEGIAILRPGTTLETIRKTVQEAS